MLLDFDCFSNFFPAYKQQLEYVFPKTLTELIHIHI